MSVIIDLGDKVLFTVPINDKSGFLYGMRQDMGNEAVVDLKYLLKSVSDISLTDYVYFLTHDTQRSVIFEQDIMIDCLKIYNITGDDNYFQYLITQLHRFWTLLSPILYSSNVNIDHNIMWDIHLHTPRQLLPQSYVNNKVFYNSWLERNNGKDIVLNDIQKFTYKTKKGEVVNDEISGSEVVNSEVVDSQIIKYVDLSIDIVKIISPDSEITQCNKKIQGKYTIKQHLIPASNAWYINDKPNGPETYHYSDTQKLMSKVYNHNGLKHGLYTTFYRNGNIMDEIVYDNGVIKGKRSWYNDRVSTLRSQELYVSGTPVESKHFYPDGHHADITYSPTEHMGSVKDHTITMFDQG